MKLTPEHCPDREASHIMYMIAQEKDGLLSSVSISVSVLSSVIQRLQLQKQIKKG